MVIAFAIACFVVAAAAALTGVVTEYRQTRAEGPVAMVGTMQWSPVAAIFSLIGLLALRPDWWWYPIVFVTVLFLTGWAIIKAGKSAVAETNDL
jgi:hypothetical protein